MKNGWSAKIRALLLACAFFLGGTLRPQSLLDSIAEMPLVDSMMLLGGRIAMRVPENTDRAGLPDELIDAWADPATVDHFRMQVAGHSVLVRCQELHALAGRTLLQDWRTVTDPGGDGGMRFERTRTAGMEGVLYHVVEPEDAGAHVFVQGAVLHGADGALLWLQAYLPRAALPESKGFTALLDRVFASSTSGGVALRTDRRTAFLDLFGGRDSLAIDLPAGYVLLHQQGEGQVGHRIMRMGTLLEASMAELLVVHGADPVPMRSALGLTDGEQTSVSGTMLNHAMVWGRFVDQDGAIRILEARENGVSNGVLQVSLIGATEQDLDTLRAIAATIRRPLR